MRVLTNVSLKDLAHEFLEELTDSLIPKKAPKPVVVHKREERED